MGNHHAPFWIGGGGSNPFADHTPTMSGMRIIVVGER